MGDIWPDSVTCEKDIRVAVDYKMSMSLKCEAAAKG